MKKLVFAAQVFGLIALFPAVIILEMNHGKRSARESDSTSCVKPNTEKISIRLPEKITDKMENEAFTITLKTFLLNKAF